MDIFLIWVGRFVSFLSRLSNIGAGETWPGHLALELRPSILGNLEKKLARGSVLITGTNGKTTTAKLLRTILEKGGFKVVHNPSGANLLNGIASSLILDIRSGGKPQSEIGVFEVDEGNFPLALEYFTPEVVVLLNLSRDQLDRYGEVDLTLEKWEKALLGLPQTTRIVINSDEGKFGKLVHQLTRVGFQPTAFSLIKPAGLKSPLPGDFNQLNTNAAVMVAKILGIDDSTIGKALIDFKPAFGRGEELKVKGRKVKILLAKNPASFNANLKLLSLHFQFHPTGKTNYTRRVAEETPSHSKGVGPAVLLALNDNIPDGRDVSWIFDIDFEKHTDWLRECRILVSGKRAFDLALRLKYAGLEISNFKFQISNNLRKAIFGALEEIPLGETLYILPTYSAMLEVRKILTGQAIGTPDG